MYSFTSLMYEFIVNNKLLLIAYIVVLIIIPIQDVGIAHVIGKLLEALRAEKVSYYYIYVLIGMIAIVQAGHALNDFIEVRIYPMFQKFICTKIIDYIFDKSSSNLQEILTGKILTIMSHCPRTMYNYMDMWRTDVIPQVVVFAVVITYISLINVKLGAIVAVTVVFYAIAAIATIHNCTEPSRKRESYLIQVNEEVDDVFMNIVGIMNANQQQSEMNKLGKYYDMYKKFGELAMKCTMKYKFMLVPIVLASLVLYIIVGFNAVKNKEMKVEKFIVSIIIYLYVFNSIIRTINDVRDAAIRSGMVNEHLKVFQSMKDTPENASVASGGHESRYLYFDRVGFYHGSKPILKDFTLEIKKGEKLLIIGQIGSGKTTILKMLMRYSNPSSGHIYYRGTPFERIPRSEIRKRIGYIPQNPILLNRTLYENITYGTPGVSRGDVLTLIRDLELDKIFGESRLDQQVGKHGSALSGGQRQVVWILRVLVQNPEILIMDEPTSAIDKDTKQFIDRLFETVMKNRTVVIVSHDEYMSKLCDRTIKIAPPAEDVS